MSKIANANDYEQYDYDTNSGYLYRIQFNGVTVWQLTTMDEYLRTRQANIGTTSVSWSYDGNNLLSQVAATGVQRYDYSFDVNTGNLISRSNYLKSKTESFGYDGDNLDKLSSVTGPVNLSLTYTADKNGNILNKTDAGTYVYDATQPYAVDQVTGGQNISTTPQDISYYSFEKVKTITEGTKSAEFVYNAEQQRIRMVLKTNGTATKTRWYFGGSCERELAGGVTTQYIWIGGDAYSAKAVAKKVGTGVWTVYNIFRDHLGTITHLKDATTGTVTEYSFDAWGRRRDKDDWMMTLTGEPALFADRGYTAHEYLEDFKLYNMNGRLYDPVVGRFLNADPVIQDAGNTQNYNRYSYCLNNPLKYSDPSGYIRSHYWLKSHDEFSSVINGDSNGGGGGGFGLPGRGGNGSGLNGTYYDWFSGTYRSTVSGNPEVSWNNVYYNLIATGNTYSTLDMGRHDRVYENAYRPNPDGKIRLFVTYTDYVIGAFTGGQRDWLNKTQIGVESYSLVNSSKEELFELAAKTDGSINNLMYVKGVKLVSKGLAIAGAAATVYDTYNDIHKGNYYSATTRAVVFAIGAGAAATIPVAGWAVAGGIGLADAIWGDRFYSWVELNLRK